MGKEGRILPGILRVAIGAPAAQLAGMHVAVARGAGWVQGGEGSVRVVALEDGAVLRIDVFGGVALGALELRVSPFELPSRLRVIEFLLGRRPSHQPVLEPVVLRVATRAIVAARRLSPARHGSRASPPGGGRSPGGNRGSAVAAIPSRTRGTWRIREVRPDRGGRC